MNRGARVARPPSGRRALAPPPAKSADKDEAAEATEEHERCVGTALRALAALLEGVPAKAAATQLEPLLEPHLPSLWPLGGAKAPSVRAALFALCLALLKAVPELAERELAMSVYKAREEERAPRKNASDCALPYSGF